MAEPQPPEKNRQRQGEVIKPLRTFEGDIEEALHGGKISATEIVAAESERAREKEVETLVPEQAPEHPERKKMLVIVAGVIIVAGIAGGIAWFLLRPKSLPPPPLTETGQTIITIDLEKSIDLTNLTYKQSIDAIVKERDAAALRVSSTEGIAFVTRDLAGNATKLKTEEFLKQISPSIPASLTRSLEENFAFGLIGFDGNHPFLILRTNSFQSAYDGMLRGEVDFYREAGQIFVTQTPLPGLSSSTAAYYGTDPTSQLFRDIVINNIDTRAVKNDKGEIVFLYAFPDQATIVITTNQKTFGEIIQRLKRSRLIR